MPCVISARSPAEPGLIRRWATMAKYAQIIIYFSRRRYFWENTPPRSFFHLYTSWHINRRIDVARLTHRSAKNNFQTKILFSLKTIFGFSTRQNRSLRLDGRAFQNCSLITSCCVRGNNLFKYSTSVIRRRSFFGNMYLVFADRTDSHLPFLWWHAEPYR